MSKLMFETDYIGTAIEETPQLLEFMIKRFKKNYRNELLQKHIKDYEIPCSSYKGVQISKIEINVLKMMLKVSVLKEEYPLVYYSIKYFVENRKFV